MAGKGLFVMRRRHLALAVLIGMLVLTWTRTELPPPDYRPILTITPVDKGVDKGSGSLGPFTIAEAWELDSPNDHFGSYSALLALPDGTLLAASDSGRYLRFDPENPGFTPQFGRIAGTAETRKNMIDVEAATRDPHSGQIWLAYEGTNMIQRRDSALKNPKAIMPARMRNWASNSGPEAFVRLKDGRFIVLSEGARTRLGSIHTGLIYPDDPVEGPRPERFALHLSDGYRPADMAQLPDGRVLILTRKVDWGIPPGFRNRLVIADPTDLTENTNWTGTVLGEIASPLPSDNFEGLDVVDRGDGTLALWLISDDNRIGYQRTLLLKLHWKPDEVQPSE